jgi:flagellin
MLATMRGLVIHASNRGVVTYEQVLADQAEVDNMLASINRINEVTRFAGNSVFRGSGVSLFFHIGEGATADDQVAMSIQEVSCSRLGRTLAAMRLNSISFGGTNDLDGDPQAALDIVDAAVEQVAALRGNLGAFVKNTLQTNINSLNVALENVTATESFIRDANMAEETSNFTRNQILVQAGVAALAQANVLSQSVLQLLR